MTIASWVGYIYKVGPLPARNGVITPKSTGEITPVKAIYFRPCKGPPHEPTYLYGSARGPPTLVLDPMENSPYKNHHLPTEKTPPRRQGQGLANDRSAPSSSSLFFRKFSSKFNSFCRSSCRFHPGVPNSEKLEEKPWNPKMYLIEYEWYIDLISLFPHTLDI